MTSASLENGAKGQLKEWGDINWRRARKIVKNLRGRIFRAQKLGNYTDTLRLQKLLKRSRSNLLLSIRQCTQVNTGKHLRSFALALRKQPPKASRVSVPPKASSWGR